MKIALKPRCRQCQRQFVILVEKGDLIKYLNYKIRLKKLTYLTKEERCIIAFRLCDNCALDNAANKLTEEGRE